MSERRRPVTIAVAGGTGSGKTTVSNAILERVGSHNIACGPHDAYYRDRSDLTLAERRAINFDHPDSLYPAGCTRKARSNTWWRPSRS